MGKYTKEQAVSVVISCAEKYSKELENRTLLFVCRDKHKNLTYQQFTFFGRNFLHLTGLKLNSDKNGKRQSASDFYSKCLHRKLSIQDFEFAEDGTTPLKLDVLPFLITGHLSAKMIGNYNSSRPRLYTEKLAGSVKACMGFRTDSSSGTFVPDTVLNEDIRNFASNHVQVIVAFRTEPNSNLFCELTYAAKGVDLSQLNFSEEYSYLSEIVQT